MTSTPLSQSARRRFQGRWGRAFPYLVAAGFVVAATLVRSLLDPWLGDALPYITYFAAIVAAAWFGRLGPSLLAVALSCIAADWFFLPPRYSLWISFQNVGEWLGLAVFLFVGAIVAALSESLHRARQSAVVRWEWLQVTLKSIGDAVIATDHRGIVLMMNPVAEALTGWTASEAAGRPLQEVFRIVNVRTRLPVEDPCGKVLATGRIVGLANHTVLLDRNGAERPIDDSAAPIINDLGEMLGVVLVFRDATQTRRAQENAERLAAIVEHSDDAIIGKDLESTITSWNAAAERLYGFTAQEAIGRPMSIIVPSDRQAELDRIMERVRRGEQVEHLETVRLKKDGTRVEVSLTVSPIRNAYGEVIGASKSARDISQRIHAEEALHASEARKTAFFHTALDCIISIDHEGKVLEFNPAAERTFGYHAVEVVGKELASLIIPPAMRETHRRGLAHFLATGEGPILNRRLELTGLRSDGAELPVELTVTRILVDGPVVFTAHLRDITDRKQLENQLRQYIADLSEADRRKDEFLAMLAHELRNPIAAINGAVLLFGRLETEEELEWANEVIQRQVKHLSRLIDDLLDVSRVTRGKIGLRKEPLDLALIVSAALENVRSFIEDRKHEVNVSLAPGELRLDADPMRLEQILINLLTNAAKYTTGGGRIWLTASREHDEIVIKVRDTGVGISSEMLPRIFDLFAQGDRTIDRSEGGLGVGLTIVQKLVALHGGTVVATSEGQGKGSEFTVRLPASTASHGIISRGDTLPRMAHASSRVLVVDDNLDMATGLAKLLKLLGHDVHIASDGQSAIALAMEFRPEVILLDIGLPGMSGYEVVRRLRAEDCCRDSLIIAVTGYGQDEDLRKSQEAGFDHHLVKPIDYQALMTVMSQAN